MASASVFVVGMAATGSQAIAECAPDPVGTGGSVTCTGTDANGFGSGSSNVAITVSGGAVVTTPDNQTPTIHFGAIQAGVSGTTLLNNGKIERAPDIAGSAVEIWGDDTKITNNGTIAASNYPFGSAPGIRVSESENSPVGGDTTIVNTGTVVGSPAIWVDGGNSATVTNLGTVASNGGTGIQVDNVEHITITSGPDSHMSFEGTAIAVNAPVPADGTSTIQIIQEGGSVLDVGFGGIVIGNSQSSLVHLKAGSTTRKTTILSGRSAIEIDTVGSATVIVEGNSRIEASGEFNAHGILVDHASSADIQVAKGATITVGGTGDAIHVTASQAKIVNDGVLVGTGLGGGGIDVSASAESKGFLPYDVVNNGEIHTGKFGTGFSACCDGSVRFENNGLIFGNEGVGVYVAARGGEVLNTGTITSNGAALGAVVGESDGPQAQTLTLVNTGQIDSIGGGIVDAEDDAMKDDKLLPVIYTTRIQQAVAIDQGRIENGEGGHIDAYSDLSTAIRMTDSEYATVTLVNKGSVNGQEGEVARFDDRDANGDVVRNDRFVPGAIDGGAGTEIIENWGVITGGIGLGGGDDILKNLDEGSISGSINMGEGADTVTNAVAAEIESNGVAITMADGGNVSNAGYIFGLETGIVVGDGNMLQSHATGTIETEQVGIIVGDDNGVLNAGNLFARGSGKIGISAGSENSTFLGEDGLVGITNTGKIWNFETGIAAGNSNSVVNIGDIDVGTIGISVQDNNTVVNEGDIKVGPGGIAIKSGEASVIRNDGMIDSGGDGIVTVGPSVSNSGTIVAAGDAIAISGDANAVVNNSGTVTGLTHAVHGGTRDDSVFNSGALKGGIVLGAGSDTLNMRHGGTVIGDVDGGDDAGADQIFSQGTASISGKVTNFEHLVVTDGQLLLSASEGSRIDKTTVEGGTLWWNSNAASNITVSEAGTLTGSGEITGDVENSGTLAAGYQFIPLKVAGDYTQTGAGVLQVELGQSSSDSLLVSGSATLDGILATGLRYADLGALEGKSYTVLTAGGISGAFDNLGTVQQGFWTLDVEQTGTAVIVTVVDVDLTIGASVPFTGALAGAIGNAAPATAPQGAGIVVEGHTDTVTEGDQQQAASLNYDSLGDWEIAAASYTGGFVGLGDRTPAVSMPKTGTAAFEGITKGELTETGSPEAFVVEGNVVLSADFASGLVNANFTGMEKIDSKGVETAWVDFRARMSIADGTSEFAGTAGTDDGVWNGEARGGFFGDEGGMPGGAAGLWSISSPLGQALGGFTAKRQ